METGELLQSLNTHGHQMLGNSGSPEDLTKGFGLVLLALEAILSTAVPVEAGSHTPALASFKAKANRW